MAHGSQRRTSLPTYAACMLLSYMTAAGVTAIFAMTSTLYRVFDDPLRVGWVLTTYYLTAAGSAAICGRFADLLGRRTVGLVILITCAAGAVISAVSPNLYGVILGCALQGPVGGIFPLAVGILRENLAKEKVPFAIGVMSATTMVGSGITFLTVGAVIDHYSWQGGFYCTAVLATITAACLLAFVKKQSRTGSLEGISVLPGLLFAPAVAGIFVAIQMARNWGWGDPRVSAVIVASLLGIVLWAYHQSRQATPLINIRALGTGKALLANFLIVTLAVGWMQEAQILSLFLQQPAWTLTGFAISGTLSGLILMGVGSVSMVASPWGGHMAARHGTRHAALVGALIGIVGWSGLIVYHSSVWFVIFAAVMLKIGQSVLGVTGYNLVVEATPLERTSEATGLTQVFVYIFMAIGAQIIFLLLAAETIADPAKGAGTYPADTAYTLTFGYVSFMGLVGLIIAYFFPRKERAAPAPEKSELASPPAGV